MSFDVDLLSIFKSQVLISIRMGKVKSRGDQRRGVKGASGSGGRGRGGNDIQLKKTVGKISADISAISLGPPSIHKSKILKKTTSSSGLLTSNFASRLSVLNKQKKKVTFCQNLIAEGLKDQKRTLGENAKHYFKVIHPSAIAKRSSKKGAPLRGSDEDATDSLIPDGDEVLLNTATPELRRMIKSSVKCKKIRLKAKKETFKKRMELIKLKRDEVVKAKQRQQTAIVGDMHPMLQALPSFAEEEDRKIIETELAKIIQDQEDQAKSVPKKTKYNVKKTQKAILDSLKFFEAAGVSAGLTSK
ncbi:hypothetical protein Ocin01_12603 [Orchesella cincta]|uniref:Ribosome biogenesis protein SLX9 n=1 Tax=Orchesella cincta TaxID=48709 RepID=A0A1D2MMM8_ORCCI|nr:hypothetical protein Ocin01_12603 [Orchesella cincta]